MDGINFSEIDAKIDDLGSQIRGLLDGTHPIGSLLTESTPLKVKIADTIREVRQDLTDLELIADNYKKLLETQKMDFNNALSMIKQLKSRLKNLIEIDKTFTSGISDSKKLFEVTGEM